MLINIITILNAIVTLPICLLRFHTKNEKMKVLNASKKIKRDCAPYCGAHSLSIFYFIPIKVYLFMPSVISAILGDTK